MTAAGGFTVEPEVLDSYSTGLDDRAQRVVQASQRVDAASGFDLNAFGILIGQVLAIPARIALADLQGKLHSAADGATSAAEKVRSAAKVYRETDGDHSKVLDGLRP
jgi:hypothetical protein